MHTHKHLQVIGLTKASLRIYVSISIQSNFQNNALLFFISCLKREKAGFWQFDMLGLFTPQYKVTAKHKDFV